MDTALSVEDDLDRAWEKTIKRLEDEAGLQLPADRRVDDVAAIINPPKLDPTTKTKVKDIFTKALRCIDRFGGMVAQAGSIVFGPSNQVYNAVSFLIHVSQGVQEVFDNVTLLMTRLSIFLERLGLYFDRTGPVKIDHSMRRSMYRVLEHFVQVMVLSYKLTHRWKGKDGGWKGKVEVLKGKAKVIMKVGAFGDDSGIKAAIADFEQAVADVSDVQIDEIHRKMDTTLLALGSVATTVQEIHTDTQEIRTDTQEILTTTQEIRTTALETATLVEQLRGSEDEKKTEEKIRKVICILDKEDPDSVTKRAHDDYASRISGTGTWLVNDNNEFQQWKDVRGSPDVFTKILMIQGPEGFGKSYLTHAIIDHLQKESQKLKNPLTMRLAWHYFQNDSKPTSIIQALKYVVWQLAKSDTSYTSFLKTVVPLTNATEAELWSRLVADYSIKRRPTDVFFIILDGVDRADQKSIKALEQVVKSISRADEPEQLRIRLLLTGNRDSLQDLYKQSKTYSTIVDLEPHQLTTLTDLPQKQDVQAFVSEALDNISLFRGTLSREQQELKNKILEKLPLAVPGDYNDLKRRLVEIKNSEETGQIEELVEKVGQDSKNFITDQILTLNEQQSGAKIRQINEILILTSAAKNQAYGKLLQSTIDVVFEGRGLINIIDFIRKECNKLLEVSGPDNDVSFKADAEEALQNAQAIRPTVNDTEINMIQAMLQTTFERTFGSHDIYKKFDFPRFFDEKRKMQNDLVHLPANKDIALRTLETCLRAICDIQDSEKSRPLRLYAGYNFDDHLTEADFANADKATKAQIGRRLFRVLREEAVIDTWTPKNDAVGFDSMLYWFEPDNKFFDSLVACMKDPEVEKSVQATSTETDWLYKEDYDKVPNSKILQHVVRHVLHRWIAGDYGDSREPLVWLRAYFRRTGPYNEAYTKGYWWTDCSAEELACWSEWAWETSGLVLDKAEWQYRIAIAHRLLGEWNNSVDKDVLYTRACTKCVEVIKMDPSKWKAQLLHATILHDRKDYQASVDQFEKLQANPGHAGDESYEKTYWEKVVWMFADCYLNLEMYDLAIDWCRKGFEHEIANEKESYSINRYACYTIEALRKQNNTGGAVTYLESLNQQTSDGKRWLHFLLEIPYSEIHNHIIALAFQTETFETMNGYYAAAIKDGSEDVKISGAWTHLRYVQWKLHWYCSGTTSRDLIIDDWMMILESTNNSSRNWSWTTRYGVSRQLAHALFYVATQPHLSSDQAQAYIKRLEDMCKKIDDLLGYSLFRDVRLVLARLLHLNGESERARDVLRTVVREAIDTIRDEDMDDRGGYRNLALIFPVLDDDENAQAAWSLMEPDREEEKKEDSKDTAVEEDAVKGKTDDVKDGIKKDALTNDSEIVNGDDTVTSASSEGKLQTHQPSVLPPSPALPTSAASDPPQNTTPSSTDPKPPQDTITTPTAPDPESPQDKDTKKLSGILGLSCDGRCGKDWTYAEEMYICRDCLCVQLDPSCYAKLQRGELDVDICHKSHRHLHVPPFDVEAWRARDAESVRVGGEVITREGWVRRIEKEWGLWKWDLAVRGIHRFKLNWLARRKMKGLGMKGGVDGMNGNGKVEGIAGDAILNLKRQNSAATAAAATETADNIAELALAVTV